MMEVPNIEKPVYWLGEQIKWFAQQIAMDWFLYERDLRHKRVTVFYFFASFCNASQMIYCRWLTWASKYIMGYFKLEWKTLRSRFSWRKDTLTHFISLVSFYIPWKYQTTRGFLIFSGGIERGPWHEII